MELSTWFQNKGFVSKEIDLTLLLPIYSFGFIKEQAKTSNVEFEAKYMQSADFLYYPREYSYITKCSETI
jgi:hypothetical protein